MMYQPQTCGTHVYNDKETIAGKSYLYKLVSQDTGLSSASSLQKSYAKVESLSIAELNEFVIAAPSQLPVRYRVEIANEVGHLLAGEGVNPDKIQAPPFVAATEGKAYIFQGGDDDNGDDNPDAISVPAKVEINGSSRAKMFSEKVMKALYELLCP
ncbi:hypothetical protein Bca101_065625 [Brassica carinata]